MQNMILVFQFGNNEIHTSYIFPLHSFYYLLWQWKTIKCCSTSKVRVSLHTYGSWYFQSGKVFIFQCGFETTVTQETSASFRRTEFILTCVSAFLWTAAMRCCPYWSEKVNKVTTMAVVTASESKTHSITPHPLFILHSLCEPTLIEKEFLMREVVLPCFQTARWLFGHFGKHYGLTNIIF